MRSTARSTSTAAHTHSSNNNNKKDRAKIVKKFRLINFLCQVVFYRHISSDLCMCIKLSSLFRLLLLFLLLCSRSSRSVLLLLLLRFQWLWFRCNRGMKNEWMKESNTKKRYLRAKGVQTMAAEPSAHDMLRFIHIFHIHHFPLNARRRFPYSDSLMHTHTHTHKRCSTDSDTPTVKCACLSAAN